MGQSFWLVAVSLTTGERRYLPVGNELRRVGRPSTQDGPDKLNVDFDPNLSRRHFTVVADGSGVYVERDGSTHPLYFAGQAVDSFRLTPGQHFISGKTRFELTTEGPAAQQDPATSMKISRVDRDRALERDAHRGLRVLIELQSFLMSAPETATLFDRLLPLVARVVPRATIVMIISVGPDGVFETVAAHGQMPPPRPTRTLLRAAMQSGEPVFHIFEQVGTASPQAGTAAGKWEGGTPDTPAQNPTMIARVGWVLAAPIAPRDGSAYILYTVGSDVAEFGADHLPGDLDRAVLALIARALTQYFEGRHAVELQMQVEAERQQRTLAETLRSLANTLTASLSLTEVLERLLGSLHEAVPFDCAIGLLRRAERLETAIEKGLPDQDEPIVIPLESPFLVRFDPSGRSVTGTPHSLELERIAPSLGDFVSVLCTPIAWTNVDGEGGREMRGLVILGRNSLAYSDAEADTATLFTSQAAIAFRNASLFEEVQ